MEILEEVRKIYKDAGLDLDSLPKSKEVADGIMEVIAMDWDCKKASDAVELGGLEVLRGLGFDEAIIIDIFDEMYLNADYNEYLERIGK